MSRARAGWVFIGLAGVIFSSLACRNREAARSVEPVPAEAAGPTPASSSSNRKAMEQFEDLPAHFGFGHPASPEEIASWDIDVMPDGTGLPRGQGTVAEGKAIYEKLCVQCHGKKGEGGDYEPLAGREPGDDFPFSKEPSRKSTVGNYWPYATTLYDYIHRAMPQSLPGTLEPNEVYSLVAYILYLNRIIPEDAVMDPESLPGVVMPARNRFVGDDRRGGPEIR